MLQPDSQLYTPCTKMSVVQLPPNGMLSGPHECELRIGDGINVETCLCQTGDQGIYMGAGAFHRKTDT